LHLGLPSPVDNTRFFVVLVSALFHERHHFWQTNARQVVLLENCPPGLRANGSEPARKNERFDDPFGKLFSIKKGVSTPFSSLRTSRTEAVSGPMTRHPALNILTTRRGPVAVRKQLPNRQTIKYRFANAARVQIGWVEQPSQYIRMPGLRLCEMMD
jgi:hypothetical protein